MDPKYYTLGGISPQQGKSYTGPPADRCEDNHLPGRWSDPPGLELVSFSPVAEAAGPSGAPAVHHCLSRYATGVKIAGGYRRELSSPTISDRFGFGRRFGYRHPRRLGG